jgi:GH15 family glucan-1,4-alpha-glucosidase
MSQPDLDLAPIGNCAASALVDSNGVFVWACAPRVDGDPMFCALLSGDDVSVARRGLWAIDLIDQVSASQSYERNTPILVTTLTDARGAAIEIVDFCPRFRRHRRHFRPLAFIRIVRPLSGSPRIRVRLSPAVDWGAHDADVTTGSNHIRYRVPGALRLTTTAPVSHVLTGRTFRLEEEHVFYLGPD